MSLENWRTDNLLQLPLSTIGVLCQKVSRFIRLALDTSCITKKIPPDHYIPPKNPRVFTQEDHDKAWKRIEEYNFTESE